MIHSAAWQPWIELYRSEGYDTLAPGWPGDASDVATTRSNAAAVANKGIDDITTSYVKIINDLPVKPIVIGHSFGGLIAQKLLDDGHAAAAVGIDPGQIKGVKRCAGPAPRRPAAAQLPGRLPAWRQR